MDKAYELLLSQVGRLYERHEAARQSRSHFNLFTVLRSPGDEVNLHSRFLHAVLDHRATPDGDRKNLRDFLNNIASVKGFRLEGESVRRESDNIDLLIENCEQAIVIENKIGAGDQERQLQRYQQTLLTRGYKRSAIRLLYLTPFGTEPSKQSTGDLKCNTVSYRDDLPRWLKRCQKRAVDDPALRESIAQYLQLIRKITGTCSEEYMADLKNLCLKDDNLILTHDLLDAFVEAKADLVARLWCDIDEVLRSEINDLPDRDPDWSYLSEHDSVKGYIKGNHISRPGLYYYIAKGAWLAVAADPRLWFGVSCRSDQYQAQHQSLLDALSRVAGGNNGSSEPWYRYPRDGLDLRNLNRDNLRMLMSEGDRPEFARALSAPIAELWQQIQVWQQN